MEFKTIAISQLYDGRVSSNLLVLVYVDALNEW